MDCVSFTKEKLDIKTLHDIWWLNVADIYECTDNTINFAIGHSFCSIIYGFVASQKEIHLHKVAIIMDTSYLEETSGLK